MLATTSIAVPSRVCAGACAAARAAGVAHLLIPAVERGHWQEVVELAHRHGDSYALGIHPLYTPGAQESDIAALRELLNQQRGDPQLVAVGEIGLDFFVPGLDEQCQIWFYEQQIRLAREFELPVILHVRKSSDRLLKTLRQHRVVGGIAHAFNGSAQQAQCFCAVRDEGGDLALPDHAVLAHAQLPSAGNVRPQGVHVHICCRKLVARRLTTEFAADLRLQALWLKGFFRAEAQADGAGQVLKIHVAAALTIAAEPEPAVKAHAGVNAFIFNGGGPLAFKAQAASQVIGH